MCKGRPAAGMVTGELRPEGARPEAVGPEGRGPEGPRRRRSRRRREENLGGEFKGGLNLVGWWRGEGFDGVGVGWWGEKLGFGGGLEKKLGGW